MKYIKPHLSPELRAQITPHKRRDIKLIVAGVIFSFMSVLLVINLWPVKDTAATSNNKPVQTAAQSELVYYRGSSSVLHGPEIDDEQDTAATSNNKPVQTAAQSAAGSVAAASA